MDPRKRLGGRPGLGGNRAGNRRDEGSARFRLPPGVDDRATAVADHAPVPFPGVGVDRFAHGAQQAKRFSGMPCHPIVAFALEGANGRRSGVEDRDAEPVDRLPEAAEVGIVGDAVEHDALRSHHQRSVNDVAMPGDPADVGSAPEDVVGPIVEDPVEGRRDPGCVAAGSVDDALRLSGGPGSVKDE